MWILLIVILGWLAFKTTFAEREKLYRKYKNGVRDILVVILITLVLNAIYYFYIWYETEATQFGTSEVLSIFGIITTTLLSASIVWMTYVNNKRQKWNFNKEKNILLGELTADVFDFHLNYLQFNYSLVNKLSTIAANYIDADENKRNELDDEIKVLTNGLRNYHSKSMIIAKKHLLYCGDDSFDYERQLTFKLLDLMTVIGSFQDALIDFNETYSGKINNKYYKKEVDVELNKIFEEQSKSVQVAEEIKDTLEKMLLELWGYPKSLKM